MLLWLPTATCDGDRRCDGGEDVARPTVIEADG